MESYVYAFYLIQCDNKGNFSFDLNEKSESWSSRKSITQYTMDAIWAMGSYVIKPEKKKI